MSPLLMTLMLAVGWGVFAYSALRRWNLMKVGAPAACFDRPGERIALTLRYAIAQIRMRRYPLAGIAHMLIFFGFGVLLLRSLILWGRGYDESFNFWIFGPGHWLGETYSFFKDLFAVLVILGALVFVYYRMIKRLPRMTLSTEGLVIIWIIVVMMLADIVYDGAKINLDDRAQSVASVVTETQDAKDAQSKPFPFYVCEPAGSFAAIAVRSLSDGQLNCLKHAGFWTHAALVLIFLNLLPYSKHFHVITAIPNVYLQSLAPPGRLPNLEDIEGKLEREETLGIKRIDQFSWKAILDWYTCTECGRCTDQCPAASTGKKLSPKHFTLDLRDFLYKHENALVAAKSELARSEPRPSGSGQDDTDQSVPPSESRPSGSGQDDTDQSVPPSEPRPPGSGQDDGDPPEQFKDLVDGVIDPEVLWACTTCRACEQECPVFITYVDKIVDMRRYLAQERGEFPAELQTAFRALESVGNPWGFPAEDRDKWAEGLDVKTIADNPDADVLFWIGCAPAFDDRAKKVTRATAKLMIKAGVNFAILGTEETCTGDAARRAGNEYLFQMFAQQNVETLNGYGVDKKTIVCTCPHCFNTLKNEYPDFGGNYDVVHHSTFLARLLESGKLKPTKRVEKKIAFHDSCYLGRYNEVYDAPRNALRSIPGLTVLEPAQTRDRGMCCGAGGAQMFKEEEPGDERVSDVRTQQLLDTNPDALGSSCPFCMRMLTDGLGNIEREEVPSLDIAELLMESMEATPSAVAET